MTALKLLLLLIAVATVPGLSAYAASRSAGWRRLVLAVLVLSFCWHPLMTFDYQFGSKFNVRGWEFCWADLIALGLAAARLRDGATVSSWLTPLVGLWTLHLVGLALSAAGGIAPETSVWYCWRMLRALAVMLALLIAIRDREDVEAVVAGLVLTCLWNEWAVLRQKYGAGRYQTPGVFDHQNGMGMYMILAGTVMFAAWLARALRPALRWPLFVGIVCGAHALLSGLSRGSMLFYAIAMAGTGLSSLAIAPDLHKLRAISLIGVVGMLGGLAMLPTIVNRFNDRGNDASERSRELMNLAAAQMERDFPVLGLGPNNYAIAINHDRYAHVMDIFQRERGYRVDPESKRGQVESLYWQMRSECGLVGIVTLLAVMAASLVLAGAKAVIAEDPLGRAVALGAAWCMAANYVQCAIEHTLIHAPNLYLWLTLNAVVAVVPWRGVLPSRAAKAIARERAAPPVARPAATAGAGAFWA